MGNLNNKIIKLYKFAENNHFNIQPTDLDYLNASLIGRTIFTLIDPQRKIELDDLLGRFNRFDQQDYSMDEPTNPN